MSTGLLKELASRRAPALLALNVGQFHRMVELGILADGEPIELIDGILVLKDRRAAGETATHGAHHALAVALLQEQRQKLGDFGGHFRTQLPVTLSDLDEPEPDLAVVRGAPGSYPDRHPAPADLLLVVEVADSSLEHDRTTKQRLYARAGVARYWIVNLVDDRLETYEEPSAAEGRYLRRTDFAAGDSVPLLAGAGAMLHVAVTELIPPPPRR